MRLRYTSAARDHIASIHAYIAARNPAAATRVLARIRAAAERLREFPHIGSLGVVLGPSNGW